MVRCDTWGPFIRDQDTLPYRIHIVGGCHVTEGGPLPKEHLVPAYLRAKLQHHPQAELFCSPKSRIACAHFHLKRMKEQPDAIILQLGHDESLRPLAWKRPGVQKSSDKAALATRMTPMRLLLRAKAKGLLTCIYALALTLAGRPHFDARSIQTQIETAFAKIARDFPGIPVYVLSTFPMAYPYRMHIRRIINRKLRNVSQTYGWTYLNLCPRISTWNWRLFEDDIHLSAAGNQIVAEAIATALREEAVLRPHPPLQQTPSHVVSS